MGLIVGLERFEKPVKKVLSELPLQFQKYLQGLEIRVEDHPDDELMLEWGLRPPNYPFGVYEGPSVLETDNPRDFPGTIILFRHSSNFCTSGFGRGYGKRAQHPI